ncbi:DNA adenine methylase [Paenibacillus tianjinensis]|uniref:site-specific DNA-methyltransferase (adenine-specific) n=1 Tax=Paenibacillus tianjinensis TaxID=2810347 RepID=A0ABX7L5J1_9BACL|nr:DNA adenine methylase [Paenibacillus tianjinensis]QSF43355.1 DNA adenine methylase [Paenibacillus tianjinensis]
MGSKARLAKDIAPKINDLISKNNISTYIEPFVGGANMIEHVKCENRIGSDNNDYLIEMWSKLQQGWKPPEQLTKEQYQQIRDNKNKYSKELVSIAGFCATYNAKWFGGYAGIVKTKIDTYRNYYDESVRNILKQVEKLGDVQFLNVDYTYFSNYKNCLIYCDPPYQGTTQYGTSKDFDYNKFWNWVREMSKENVVLVSEYNAPEDFNIIYEKTLTTTLDKNSRKSDTEKLYIIGEAS